MARKLRAVAIFISIGLWTRVGLRGWQGQGPIPDRQGKKGVVCIWTNSIAHLPKGGFQGFTEVWNGELNLHWNLHWGEAKKTFEPAFKARGFSCTPHAATIDG